MPSDESKGSQLDAIGSLAQRQLDNTLIRVASTAASIVLPDPLMPLSAFLRDSISKAASFPNRGSVPIPVEIRMA